MQGAALSNLLSYGLYMALTIITVVPLGHFHVVDKNWWKIAVLLAGLFAINQAWLMYMPAMNIWLDSLLRTFILIGGGALIAYKTKLSPEINDQIVNSLNRK